MKKALYFSLAASLLVAGSATSASAQADPDIRDIRPTVMLLVDTSGSTERMYGGSAAALPVCSGSAAGRNDRNRWTSVVEALTGTWSDTQYYCDTRSRTSLDRREPDYNYYLPYHTLPPASLQASDGVLDVYLDRVKFGLMTFDATYTFSDAHPLLVPRTTFVGRLADNVWSMGGFSYGQPQPLTYPGCATTFMVDSGARNGDSTLVAVAVDDADINSRNAAIQSALRGVRPFGGTPTAALLDDFRFYVQNDPSVTTDDIFSECRPTFAILLTDGQPDEDFRDSRFNCDAIGGCPYDRASEIAGDLCQYSASGDCSGDIDGLFVVALDVDDATALAELDDIALRGGTGAALRASNRAELMRRLTDVLDRAAPGNTTRSRPSFVTGGSTFTTTGVPSQYEFNAGFQVGAADGEPWTGVLERTQYVCDAGLVPRAEPVASRVRFHEELNTRPTPRRLLTVSTPLPGQMTGNITGDPVVSTLSGGAWPAGVVRNQSITTFTTSNVPYEHFGIPATVADRDSRRDYVVNWVDGTTPDRVGKRFGDIYHSSPVASGPPRLDIRDEWFNLYRRTATVSNRPTIIYVGTNDGLLHAFVAENWRDVTGGTSYDAGHELWAFVPPAIVPRLESATRSHQVLVDGTPVVRDVYFARAAGDDPSGDSPGGYHSVLVMGFRGGGPGYFALDVTDPENPIFLWQYVGGTGRSEMGFSTGTPALGQIEVQVGASGRQNRGLAVLPGGVGEIDEARRTAEGARGCSPTLGADLPTQTVGTTGIRSRHECWTPRGRVLTFVDIATGQIIQEEDAGTFGSPLNGGVSLYPGGVGQTVQRVFLTDADGILWSADVSNRRPSMWTVRPMHDIFWDGGPYVGQPAYSAPLVSIDNSRQLVIMQATGNIDRLDSAAENRVISVTEAADFGGGGGSASFTTTLNWEVRLRPGEQVTGQIELFESSVYFASFESGATPTNACNIGQSRIWGVHYLNSGATPPTGYNDVVGGTFPEAAFERVPGSGVFDQHFQGPMADQLVLGVGVTQRPTCLSGTDVFDPYIGSRYRVGNVGGGTFVLTAQISGGPADPASGSIRTVQQTLPTPQAFTMVSGFAGQVDY